jgi:hypothetical protein
MVNAGAVLSMFAGSLDALRTPSSFVQLVIPTTTTNPARKSQKALFCMSWLRSNLRTNYLSAINAE